MGSALRRIASRLEESATLHASSASAMTPARLEAYSLAWKRSRHELAHPLSSKWLRRSPFNASREERDAWVEYCSFLAAEQMLRDALCRVHSNVKEAYVRPARVTSQNPHTELRVRDVSLGQDDDGTQVLFGCASQIEFKLLDLSTAISDSDLPPVTRAACASAVLLNIHPFPDGNGRFARAAFNALMRTSSKFATLYLPLRLALDQSLGGFELRLREVETNENWAPLLQYFTRLFSLTSSIDLGGNGHAIVD